MNLDYRLKQYTYAAANGVGEYDRGKRKTATLGDAIGDFVEEGVATPTTKGIITYAADGTIHIVPVRP